MMRRSIILVASSSPTRCEPLLRLIRQRQSYPVLIDDVTHADTKADASVALAILDGSHDFCRPYFRLFSELHLRHTAPPLLILAADSSEAFAVSSLRAGAAEYLTAPVELATFGRAISRWVPKTPAPPPEVPLAGGEILIGSSLTMQAVRDQIRRVAATDCNTLITGETGTGKELVAQLIHQNSKRNAHPLISINCAAIPDSLLESELFGYERGAFTGAGCTNQGKLMTANKGTVFFDEIGDMSTYAQAKILRAIETKEVQRLGANRKYETDIRIVAATHRNLDELAGADTFRRDLYFRLNVGRIHLPPLRERKADIPSLVEHMVLDLNQKLGCRIEGVADEAIRTLTQYHWPGNVRELKNVVERVFIMLENRTITEADLPPELYQFSTRVSSSTRTKDKEIQDLRTALATCNGNKSKAAERMNCSRMTLYRKMVKYSIVESAPNRQRGA